MWLGVRATGQSRVTFWGAPIPVWVSDDPAPAHRVYGSIGLEADFGRDGHRLPPSLHRLPDAPEPGRSDEEQSTMHVASPTCSTAGSSPARALCCATFENQELVRAIQATPSSKYIGQTRGWFYTLHVLATALFDRPQFRSTVSHGIVLGDDGLKDE